MKKIMTRMGALVLLTAVVLLTTTSCNDGGGEEWWRTYATVKGSQMDYLLKTDDGQTLLIAKNEVPGFKVENNMRVIADFIYLKEATPKASSTAGKQVNLKMLYEVPTEDLRFESALDSIAQDTLGKDPAYVSELWCREGYINTEYQIKGTSGRHSINMVVDDKKSTATDVYATFRHNAFGDYPERTAAGTVSFRARHLIPAGADSIRVHVNFTDYSNNKSTKSATLRLIDPPANPSPKVNVGSLLKNSF